MKKKKSSWNVSRERIGGTNHNQQVIRYARFKMNQHKPMTVENYINFQLGRPTTAKIAAIVAKHVENGRLIQNGINFHLSAKGLDWIRRIDWKKAQNNYAKFDLNNGIEAKSLRGERCWKGK